INGGTLSQGGHGISLPRVRAPGPGSAAVYSGRIGNYCMTVGSRCWRDRAANRHQWASRSTFGQENEKQQGHRMTFRKSPSRAALRGASLLAFTGLLCAPVSAEYQILPDKSVAR